MMRPPIPVRAATAADVPAAVDVLARAFIDDPAMAWVFRDAAARPRRLRRFFALIASVDATPADWSLALGDAGEPVAVAMWRPPGRWELPTSAMVLALPRLVATFGLQLRRALSMQAAMDAHHPKTPHWYLQFAGCVPAAQGRGYGGAAIRARLALCDAQGLPAALETATVSNLGRYQALGFVITDHFTIPGGPEFWDMWREPRG